MEERGEVEPDRGDAAASHEHERSSPRREDVEEAAFVVLESGRMSFFVRPRVGLRSVVAWADVQTLAFTLAPRNGPLVRRVTVGKKRLPDGDERERHWAYVDRVGPGADLVAELVSPRTYATRTRGMRYQAGAVEVAAGTYAVASHRDHAHLFFALEDREVELAPLLDQLRIPNRASYVAAVLHPFRSAAPARLRGRDRRRVSREAKVDDEAPPFGEPSTFDDELMDRFGERRFLPLEPTFLDRVGAELLLLGGGRQLASPSSCAAASRTGLYPEEMGARRGPRMRGARAFTTLG